MLNFSKNDFAKYKKQANKIVMLTAYDYFTAEIATKSVIEAILVGDSLGMVIQGNENTLAVTVEQMIYHTQAVKKGAPHAFIIVDMPYLSYHISVEETIRNAGKIIKETNAAAVKVEVNDFSTLKHVQALIEAQIPVMAHVGLTGQSVNLFGGFKVQGRENDSINKILALTTELEKIGVFAIVLECIPSTLAKEITQKLTIPTIGIGSGASCDGQIIVFHDLLGINTLNVAKFVKPYLDGNNLMVEAVKDYAKEVRDGSFPTLKHSYK